MGRFLLRPTSGLTVGTLVRWKSEILLYGKMCFFLLLKILERCYLDLIACLASSSLIWSKIKNAIMPNICCMPLPHCTLYLHLRLSRLCTGTACGSPGRLSTDLARAPGRAQAVDTRQTLTLRRACSVARVCCPQAFTAVTGVQTGQHAESGQKWAPTGRNCRHSVGRDPMWQPRMVTWPQQPQQQPVTSRSDSCSVHSRAFMGVTWDKGGLNLQPQVILHGSQQNEGLHQGYKVLPANTQLHDGKGGRSRKESRGLAVGEK